jgi:chromate reductase
MVPFQPRILQGPEIHLADSSNEFDEHGKLVSERYESALRTLMQKLRAEAGL